MCKRENLEQSLQDNSVALKGGADAPSYSRRNKLVAPNSRTIHRSKNYCRQDRWENESLQHARKTSLYRTDLGAEKAKQNARSVVDVILTRQDTGVDWESDHTHSASDQSTSQVEA